MRRKSLLTRAPRLRTLHLDDLVDTDERLLNDHHDRQRFVAPDTENLNLLGAMFTECELLHWRSHKINLQAARFVQSRISNLDVASFAGRRSVWREVELMSSRIGATEWHDSDLSQVLVSGSKLGWVNLRAAKLNDVVFDDCQIDELDLTGASVTRVALRGTRVQRLILTGVKAEHLDLRGLETATIEGLDGLRGVTLTPAQVVQLSDQLAAHIGIIVEA